jgi:hypothetical protein
MLAVAGGIFSVPLYLNLQSESPAPLRSRIIAGNNIVNALFMVVSAGVLMVSLEAGMTVSEHFLFLGIAQIAAGAALTARTL